MRERLRLWNMQRHWLLAHPIDGPLWETRIRVQRARMAQLRAERKNGMEPMDFEPPLMDGYDDGRELPPQLR